MPGLRAFHRISEDEGNYAENSASVVTQKGIVTRATASSVSVHREIAFYEIRVDTACGKGRDEKFQCTLPFAFVCFAQREWDLHHGFPQTRASRREFDAGRDVIAVNTRGTSETSIYMFFRCPIIVRNT